MSSLMSAAFSVPAFALHGLLFRPSMSLIARAMTPAERALRSIAIRSAGFSSVATRASTQSSITASRAALCLSARPRSPPSLSPSFPAMDEL